MGLHGDSTAVVATTPTVDDCEQFLPLFFSEYCLIAPACWMKLASYITTPRSVPDFGLVRVKARHTVSAQPRQTGRVENLSELST